ncbi:TonB-dependent receptor [Bordetella genomosp. 12]|uniref:TonB-dependent siderophore receptor n=1 Tax=Bordetella genomosp. 12 TaxID=463035 RepID=A0A261VBX7_9BORD|nr:TonB-dependent receptor [Bordetella genomosp. 12]OZI71042.1 TonB-dependent siderophore receptor [Bordetella genomosp. 12]
MKHPQVSRLAALALLSLPVSAALAETPAELEAVTVTASKRDQKLDSINGAAYVRGADELAANQVENTLQLGRVLPGVQFAQSGSFLFPIISVRGVTSAQDFYNPALTVYVDGVPQLPVAASQQLLDVEQVELLKGPQSTLYGRSALGGVLNVVTRQPDNDTHVRASAGVSSRDGYIFKGGASGALVKDMLYGSVSVATSDAPGRLDNPITGKDGVGGSSTNAGAAKLRLAPAGSPWEIGLAVSGECTRASQDAYVPFDDPGAGQAYVMPGFPADKADFKQRRCGGSQALNAQYDFDGWRLSALAAWQRLHYSREYPIGPYFTQQPEHWRQQVQEIRLASTGKRTVDSVFGLYRQRVTQSRDYINDLVAPMAIQALNTHSRNTSESLAAYADLTWHATEALDLSAGLRWSRDKTTIDYSGQSLNYTTFGQDPFGGQDSTRGNTVLGRVSAGYRLDQAWRVYANASQGYKPAGFNLAPSSAADAQAYGREKAVSYELGARYQGDALRAGMALYRIDVRDAQLYVSDQIGYQHLENVGKTRSSGVELDAAWDVNDMWTLGLQGNWTRARFRSLTQSACAACDDNRVPFTPAYMVAASAQANIGTAAGMLRPRVEVRRVGSQYFDIGNTLRQDAYTLINASLAWQPRSGVTVTAYINNLTDKRYRTYAFAGGTLGNYALVDPGRTVGVNVAYEY